MKLSKTLLSAAIVAMGLVAGFLIMKAPKPTAADPHGHGAEAGHKEKGGEHAGHEDEKPGAHAAEKSGKITAHSEEGHGEHAEEAPAAKGPKGGRLLGDETFSVELAILEQGVPPEFRAYAYQNGKPIDPAGVKLQVELSRLGADPETINFAKQGDYLRGDKPIVEPHSFVVRINAEHQGKAHEWEYEQVEGRVSMSEAALKSAGIDIKTAGPMKIQSNLELPGEIQFNQDRVTHVVPRLAGVVVRSNRNLGDRVAKGEVLAVLESQTLSDLRSEYFAAQKKASMAATTLKREEQLWKEKISAEQDYLQARQDLGEAEITLRNARQKLLALGLPSSALAGKGSDGLTRFEIRAPQDGVITEKHINAGEAVKEDAEAFVIADLSTVWADFSVQPKDLSAVKLGQKVRVRATGLDAEAEGVVSYVGALVGEDTRLAKARVSLQNPEGSWRPGLFVTVQVLQSDAEAPVAVPVDAIQTVGDGKVVFGRFGDQFEARPVELGRSDGQWVEVRSGLTAGTQYAASNSFVIKADVGKAGAGHDH